MDDILTNSDNLVLWLFDNKEIFNSSQYIQIMSLVQKLIVSLNINNTNEIDNEINNIEDIEIDEETRALIENNYRLPESDSDMEDDDDANDIDNPNK